MFGRHRLCPRLDVHPFFPSWFFIIAIVWNLGISWWKFRGNINFIARKWKFTIKIYLLWHWHHLMVFLWHRVEIITWTHHFIIILMKWILRKCLHKNLFGAWVFFCFSVCFSFRLKISANYYSGKTFFFFYLVMNFKNAGRCWTTHTIAQLLELNVIRMEKPN